MSGFDTETTKLLEKESAFNLLEGYWVKNSISYILNLVYLKFTFNFKRRMCKYFRCFTLDKNSTAQDSGMSR